MKNFPILKKIMVLMEASKSKANGLVFQISVRIWRSSNMFIGCQSWKVHRKTTAILLSLRALPIKVVRWDSIIVMTTSKEVVNPTQETKPRWQDKVVQKHKIWKNNLSSFFGPSYLIEEEREFVEQASLFFILYIFFGLRFHVRYLFCLIDVYCTPLGIFLNWYKLLKH